MPKTIRAKLVLVIAATIALAETIIAGLGVWQEAERYAAQKKDTLFSDAQVLASASASSVANRNVAGVYAAIRAIGRVAGVDYVEVRALDGTPFADIGVASRLTSDLALDSPASDIELKRLLTSRTLEVAVPIVNAGSVVGSLTMVANLSDLPSRLRAAIVQTLIGGGVALLVALAVALRLQKRITEPMLKLTAIMQWVGRTHNYAVKLKAETSDEVGVLIAGFNTMIDDIHERDERLKRHLERLEQEVAERTRDYRDAAATAQAANQAKSDFLATMSSRNPHADERHPCDGRTSCRLRASRARPQARRCDREIGTEPARDHQ